MPSAARLYVVSKTLSSARRRLSEALNVQKLFMVNNRKLFFLLFSSLVRCPSVQYSMPTAFSTPTREAPQVYPSLFRRHIAVP